MGVRTKYGGQNYPGFCACNFAHGFGNDGLFPRYFVDPIKGNMNNMF